MNPGWASAIAAILVMLGTAAGLIWRAGRRDGRVDELLERLTDIAEDHEDRLRYVEGRQPRRQFSRIGDGARSRPRPHERP